MTAPYLGVPVYPKGHDRPIASAAHHLMNTVVTTYENAGIVLPMRRIVTVGSIGSPAVDGEIVAVMYGGAYTGTPGNELTTPYSLRNNAPRSMSLNVELWRKFPGLSAEGQAPRAEAISAASEPLMHDSWLLLDAAFMADQLGVGVIANAGVNEPQGDYAGVTMTVEMQVP